MRHIKEVLFIGRQRGLHVDEVRRRAEVTVLEEGTGGVKGSKGCPGLATPECCLVPFLAGLRSLPLSCVFWYHALWLITLPPGPASMTSRLPHLPPTRRVCPRPRHAQHPHTHHHLLLPPAYHRPRWSVVHQPPLPSPQNSAIAPGLAHAFPSDKPARKREPPRSFDTPELTAGVQCAQRVLVSAYTAPVLTCRLY